MGMGVRGGGWWGWGAVDGGGGGDVGVGILQLEIDTSWIISLYNRSPHISEFESFYKVRLALPGLLNDIII